MNIVIARDSEITGEVVTIKEVMDDGVRAVVIGRADEERVCELADSVRGMHLRSGDHMRLDVRSNLLLEKLPRPGTCPLRIAWREVSPDIAFANCTQHGIGDRV